MEHFPSTFLLHDLMPIKFSIHRATEKDFDDLLRLNQDLFAYEHEHGFWETYDLDWTYSEDGKRVFTSYFTDNNAAAWIASNEHGEAVGYLAAVFHDKPFRKPHRVSEIEMVYIDEKYRCSGIGRTLVEEYKKWSVEKGAGILRVGAMAPNKHAREFYEKWGFAEAEIMYEINVSTT